MHLLGRAKIMPLYGQVEIGDPRVKGYPQFEAGNERVVTLPYRIVAATRSDAEGAVTVEVWHGPLSIEELAGCHLVHSGELMLQTNEIEFGNTVGSDFKRVNLPKGLHAIQVWVSPTTGEADRVSFVVDP
jgi:hypothetical protein